MKLNFESQVSNAQDVQGIGVDIVDVSRFERLEMGADSAFLHRIFTGNELNDAFESRNPAPSLAGRYALKEAVVKALPDTPLTLLDLKDVRIKSRADRSPSVGLPHDIESDYAVHGSLAHERNYAIGFAFACAQGMSGKAGGVRS